MIDKEEFMSKVNEYFPGDDDESIARIEYFNDFYDTIPTENSEYTEEKFKELDDTWRKRYRDRFFNGGTISEEDREIEDEDGTEKAMKFEDLFEERK